MSEELTDAEIVAGLRSEDAETRAAAINALFPDSPGGAVLIEIGVNQAQVTGTKQLDAGRMFQVSLFVTQSFGRQIGLGLHWVPDENEEKKIQVVRGLTPQDFR